MWARLGMAVYCLLSPRALSFIPSRFFPLKKNTSPAIMGMSELFANATLKNAKLEDVNGGEALKDKIVALYFSAHWCPPCRMFTPVLKDFHGELEDSGEFEVVFVSFDRNQEDLKTYLDEAHGDWLHVPFGSDLIKQLASKYGVSGIPALVVIAANGEVITAQGRPDVQGKPPRVALSEWKKKAAEL